ncbi:MAG: DUF3455 domain-containing protein [Ideonella sp.]|nr:DUF3455 domain-containing protein [Ideonella sp.]MCC7455372.1 DUF3455 domain-containing protein [Nitrospira sp.]
MNPHPIALCSSRVAGALAAALALGACAGSRGLAQPDVPPQLKPPSDQIAFLEARAEGVQIYECMPRQAQAGAFQWVLRAPDARLTSSGGSALGLHYAGPIWEASDGSRVLGEVQARDPGPDAQALPWLLLDAKATFGKGVLAPTRSIQRVATHGGVVPSEPCGQANLRQFVRVPYSATYFFYKQRWRRRRCAPSASSGNRSTSAARSVR